MNKEGDKEDKICVISVSAKFHFHTFIYEGLLTKRRDISIMCKKKEKRST